MSTAIDALNAAVTASAAESEALLTQLTSTNATLTTVSAQLSALIAAGNSDPAIQSAVDTLNAETAKVTAAAAAITAPAA